MNTPFLQFFLSSVKTPIFWESGGGGIEYKTKFRLLGVSLILFLGRDRIQNPAFGHVPDFCCVRVQN